MPNPIKLRAEVTEICPYGDTTFLVRMKPAGNAPRFKAGQFLHLTVDPYDPAGGFWPESRVFSIASAPGEAHIEIVYSVKGRYTTRMRESLAPGSTVWLKLPYGHFVIDSAAGQDRNVVLVAGGTGIAPFLPYLGKKGAEGFGGRKVWLYYGVRHADMILARDLLERCASGKDSRVKVFIESETPPEKVPAGTAAERGLLDIDRIFKESGVFPFLISPVLIEEETVPDEPGGHRAGLHLPGRPIPACGMYPGFFARERRRGRRERRACLEVRALGRDEKGVWACRGSGGEYRSYDLGKKERVLLKMQKG